MSTKEEHQANEQKYTALKDQIRKILPKLTTASKYIGSVDREVGATYKVDGNSAKITKHTNNLQLCIETVISNLRDKVIPALEASRQEELTEIQNIEIAEAEAERQAAEAAAAEAATATPTGIDPSQTTTRYRDTSQGRRA